MADNFEKPLRFIATLGPIGFLPAPGSFGSFFALISGWFIASYGFFALSLATLAVIIIGVIASERYSTATQTKDASEVIIDEVAGQWIVLLSIPPFISNVAIWYLAAFLLFRFFDITKIGPVGYAEKLEGGIGIMADDIVAGAIAAICLLVAQFVIYGV